MQVLKFTLRFTLWHQTIKNGDDAYLLRWSKLKCKSLNWPAEAEQELAVIFKRFFISCLLEKKSNIVIKQTPEHH